MRTRILSFAFVVLAAVSVNANAGINKVPEVKDVETLADELIDADSLELTTVNDIKDFVKKVETISAPYLVGEESLSDQEKTIKVLDAVANYAETKAEGSTLDMVEAGLLNTIIYHYKTGLNIHSLQGQTAHNLVSAVTNEAEAWQKLENTLSDYYAYLAIMHHEGGTLAQIQASGSLWRLADARYNDTQKLIESGLNPNGKSVFGIKDMENLSSQIVTEFTKKAKGFIEDPGDFGESKYFKEAANGLNEACANLRVDLDAWIKSRAILLSHCNNAPEALGQACILLTKIKKLGELEQ